MNWNECVARPDLLLLSSIIGALELAQARAGRRRTSLTRM
jgi:hypothetical protein